MVQIKRLVIMIDLFDDPRQIALIQIWELGGDNTIGVDDYAWGWGWLGEKVSNTGQY